MTGLVASLLNGVQLLKKRNLFLLEEQVLFYKSRPHFEGYLVKESKQDVTKLFLTYKHTHILMRGHNIQQQKETKKKEKQNSLSADICHTESFKQRIKLVENDHRSDKITFQLYEFQVASHS